MKFNAIIYTQRYMLNAEIYAYPEVRMHEL